MIPKRRTHDFAIPREGKAYVGTTDTFYDNEKATPLTTQEDRDYLINAINYMFPTVNVKDEDIESTWAGIRPLILEKVKILLKSHVKMKFGKANLDY